MLMTWHNCINYKDGSKGSLPALCGQGDEPGAAHVELPRDLGKATIDM